MLTLQFIFYIYTFDPFEIHPGIIYAGMDLTYFFFLDGHLVVSPYTE